MCEKEDGREEGGWRRNVLDGFVEEPDGYGFVQGGDAGGNGVEEGGPGSGDKLLYGEGEETF